MMVYWITIRMQDYTFFTYIKNGKVSIVTVEDESLLEKVIV